MIMTWDLRMLPDWDLEISKTSGCFQFQTWKFPKLQDASRLRPGNFQDLRIFPRDKSSSLWLLDPLKSLWWDFDDPLMKLSFTTWLSNFNYSRQPSLSEIPAQHLTVNSSERRTNSVTDSPQSSTLLKCLCLNKAWLLYLFRVRPTHNLFTCFSKVTPLHATFILLWWSWDLTLVNLVLVLRKIK